MIRNALLSDAKAIANIYNFYVLDTIVTFEENIVAAEEMSERILATQALALPWLVAKNELGDLVGYAYASKWKERSAYRFSVEVSVYLSKNSKKQGWGSKLYQALFAALKENDIHTVIGGISLPNSASVALHEKFGLQKVAHFKDIGFKFNKWVDVGYWQGNLNAQ